MKKTRTKKIISHKHKFTVFSWTGTATVTVKCACGVMVSRAQTKKEQAYTKARQQFSLTAGTALHRANHKLQKLLKTHASKSTYEKSALIERFMKTPLGKTVLQSGVDDDMFMSSDLFLVPSMYNDPKLGSDFMGTSVYYLGQCEQKEAVFFLYPGHARQLINVLKQIEKWEKKYKDKDKEPKPPKDTTDYTKLIATHPKCLT